MRSSGEYGLATEPIAIVGLNCKLAGEARSPDRLWQMLAAGRSAWSEIPPSRFNLKGVYHPQHDKLSTVHVRGGHFLQQDLGCFDASFFSYSAETAASLDPQIRLQLESVYEALENAGITLHEIAGSNTSVFSALFVRDYRDGIIRDEDNLPRFLPTGTGDAMFSNRVSHFYDLRGPSFTLDTGCSGGLVAFNQGVQSLRTGESNMALVCGSNLFLNPDMFKAMGSTGLLSPDGKCYTFDARANGFGRGEGIATLVIKRLSDAVAAGDPIRAIIRESGMNQDGKTDTITSPSEEAQVALMRDCYRRAGLDPADTQYFEAHGTGTAAGDPVECRAIATVFQESRSVGDHLPIGSVKTNIGHTEAVSGLASLIKVVLALENGKIPPSVNFEMPNPKIKLEDWRLRVVTALEDWPPGPNGVRRASINNFGYGGTNTHLIVENAESWLSTSHLNGYTASATHLDSQILVFSARDEQACRDMVSNLQRYLETNAPVVDFEDLLQRVAYTLDRRRTRFPWVAAHQIPVQKGVQEIIQSLQSPKLTPRRSTRVPRIGMVFTGQGAQWHAMGRELIMAYPVFKASLKETDKHVKAFGAKWSIIEELGRDAETTRVNTVELSTPLCVAVQISLVRLLRSWGIHPAAVTSHSSGEIAAAYTLGALSCQSAMAVAYYRGLLAADKSLQSPNQGAMAAMGLGFKDTKSYIAKLEVGNQTITVACVNSPSSTTVSGDEKAILALEALARSDDIFTRRLKVQTAFHSSHMSRLAKPYRGALQRLLASDNTRSSGRVSFSSSVTGRRVDDVSLLSQPDHWVDSLLQPVQFADAFTDMVIGESDTSGTNVDVIVEVGPHTALGGPIKQILSQTELEGLDLPYVGCLTRGTSALGSMQSLAASLLKEGLPVNLDAVNFPYGRPSSVGVLSDLPCYPWNHQSRHWYESRFNKALRQRERPPHELLGSLVLGADRQNPVWRQILRLRDTPWLRQHVVQNHVLYPGGGFVSLAIEAMKEAHELQSEKHHTIVGYRLREINIVQALVIPENDDGVELQISLRQVSKKEIGNRGWKRFEVSSVSSENEWTIHARGFVTVDLMATPDKFTPKPCPPAVSGYSRHIEANDLYTSLRSVGISHGALFQVVTNIEQAGDHQRADSRLFIPDTGLPIDLPYRSLVHPTTFDGVIQTIYAPLLGSNEDDDGKVPRSIGSVWVSSGISNASGHEFKAFTTLRHANAQALRADVTVANDDDGTKMPVLEIREAVCQSLGRNATALIADNQWEKEPCMKVEWAPDSTLMSRAAYDQIRQQLSHPVDAAEVRLLTELRRVCMYYIFDALSALTPGDLARLQDHHAKFHSWMQHQARLAADGFLAPDSASWSQDTLDQRQNLIDHVKQASVNGEMVCRLGPQLLAILRQETTPLELMMEEDLLNRYYRNVLKSERSLPQAANLLQHLVHKNPRARILEIGSGTGGLTRHVLSKIGTSKTGGALADLYHFTDISPAFFKSAQEQFAAWDDLMVYDKLDIEVDPATQGFELGSYDIVLAAQVLHATKSIANTMSHVRQLMKPGGTLLVVETTQDQLDTLYTFGLLPGWWLSEEPQRSLSPSLSLPFFDEALKAADFSGIDFKVRDCESDEWHMMNVITSTAGPGHQPSVEKTDSVVLVARSNAPCDPHWLEALRAALAVAGQVPPVIGFESADSDSYHGRYSIFLGEVDQQLMHGLNAAELESLKTMIKHSRGLLWVTRGGAVNCERPEHSLAAGFLRSLRHEYVGRKYITLDLDPNDEPWSDASSNAITQVFASSFQTDPLPEARTPPYELEYAERDGVVLVPRLFPDNDRNQAFSPKEVDWTSPETLPTEPFFQPDRPLALKVGRPGSLDTLVFDDDPASPEQGFRFPQDMIEIEPRAYGVNFRDLLVAMGQLEHPVMGVECAGVITRVGSRAAARGYAAGDEVFALLHGGYGSRARVDWTHVMHMPPGLSFEQAASVPAVFATVYLCFYKVTRLQRGQTVLIHAGAGGVGQTAIQFAKLLGAEVYTTVGSPEKRTLLMERYGIPTDHIFSSRDTSFARGILEATDGRGVDVVLNSLAGPLLQESFNIVAPFGHFIELGKRDLEENQYLEMRPFSRHVTFSSFDLLALARHDGRLVHSALAEVGRLLEEGAVSPVHPLSTYPLSDLSKALRLLQAGKHTGKVVLSVPLQQQVRVLPRPQNAHLRSDASYLLVGGAGGIGRSIAHWLAAHGAKNLVVLSRNAVKSPAAQDLVKELHPRGCRVKLISCDASDKTELAAALDTCSTELPPIRGAIQAAMVLQDSVFERMTFSDYETPMGPKVKVSWNLHSQLSTTNLDFLIMLSSMSGLYGYTTQLSYAAGNAYQDALAHWRVSKGLPAVALDLGPVKGVGYVSEVAGVIERMARIGIYPVTEQQVLLALESAVLSPFDKQVALGINQGPGPHWHPEDVSLLGRDARFRSLQYRTNKQRQTSTKKNGGSNSLASQLRDANTIKEAEKFVVDALVAKLADIFMIPTAHIDDTKHLSDYGLDSLGAVELRNMLAMHAGTDISIFSIMQSDSIAGLASEVSRKSTHVDSSLFLTNGFH